MDLTNMNSKAKGLVKQPVDMSTMVYGKVPPQATEMEKAILGAIMIERDAFDKAMEVLKPECFYLEAHQRIYSAMQRLAAKSLPIDILTVAEDLLVSGELEQVGGAYYVTKLTNDVVSSSNLPTHARVVYQKYVQRALIRIGGELVGEAFEGSVDVFDLVDIFQNRLSSLSIAGTIRPYQALGEVAGEVIKDIQHAKETKAEITGVPSGLRHLDVITQGWQPTNLIIVAARPGVGKSALAGNFAYNAAKHPEKPTPVGIFSLEMGVRQWVTRMISAETQIPMYDLKRGHINDEQMKTVQVAGMITFPQVKIFLDDTASLDIHQLKSKARIMVLKEKVGMIIVDYLQLVSGKKGPGSNREQEISGISRELKQLAKELQIPVIALSQLSRAGDTAEPQLRNLRESGAIEQDADDVFFLTEPEEEAMLQDASLRESVLIKIAKHRNGILVSVPVKFVKSIQKIMSEGEYDRYKSGTLPASGNWKPVQANLYQTPPPVTGGSPEPGEDMPF